MRRFRFLICLFTFCFVFELGRPLPGARADYAGVKGSLSLVPGLGQIVNGDVAEGFGWFASVALLTLSGNSYFSQIGFDLWMYNMYDAYRDAKPSDQKFSDENVFYNYIAIGNPLNIIDPIGAGFVATGAVAGFRNRYPGLRSIYSPILYGFVGLGEEGLFRGFLFPGFSWVFNSEWAGAITSSALFSLAHATGGKENLHAAPMAFRFVAGMLFSWQAHRNKYDLRKNIFAHCWFDVLVTSGHKIDGGMVKIQF